METSTIWVCADCLFAREGYGVGEPDREPWGLMPGADVDLGTFHDPSCGAGGEQCDQHNVIETSSSPCPACGSELEGTRYAYTLYQAAQTRAAG
jgi:hypothetical protein